MASFIMFLTLFLAIYALLHAYLYYKVHRHCPLAWRGRSAVLVVLAFLFLCPVLGRLARPGWGEGISPLILHVGYEWMAFLFLFVCAQGAVDLIRGLLALARRPEARLWGGRSLALSLAAALAAGIYGHFEAKDLRVETLELETAKLPPHLDRLRVVQISDLHLGEINGAKQAERIARRVSMLAPDVIVATGDFLDRGIREPERMQAAFKALNPPLGKYAVTGNHEFYAGLEQSLAFMEGVGFEVLRNRAAAPAPWLVVAGMDDPAGTRQGRDPPPPAERILSGIPPGRLVILLTHRPRVEQGALGGFDIQLSGHTHGGQIFPFGLVVAKAYPYFKGLYEPGNGSLLYVSRGTGTWGPPVRVLSPPEITLVVFSRP